jgi:hypothetical protein
MVGPQHQAVATATATQALEIEGATHVFSTVIILGLLFSDNARYQVNLDHDSIMLLYWAQNCQDIICEKGAHYAG